MKEEREESERKRFRVQGFGLVEPPIRTPEPWNLKLEASNAWHVSGVGHR